MDAHSAADLLGMKPTHMNRMCAEGRIDSTVTDAGTYDVSPDEVVRILNARDAELQRVQRVEWDKMKEDIHDDA